MADHVRGAVVKEVDTNSLFEKYTIEEIREIEKKTRQDIERKKEDLRIMVGERYRELIEAADTISEMKNSVQNVLQSVGRIQDQCGDLRQTFQAKTFSSLSSKANKDKALNKKDENHFYTMAVQIKLLMDMPEKIWSALDGSHYLQATRLFLLARHVQTGLQTLPQYGGKVHGWFPVLTRQWAAISHFRPTIIQACRRVLCDVSLTDAVTAECLCSVLLLEDSTPRQVFNEFLTARSTSVSQLFQTDQGAVSIKSQICEVVQTLVTTVHQVYTIFCSTSANNMPGNNQVDNDMLMEILSKVTDKGEKGVILTPSDISISSKYESKNVYNYRPQLQQHGTSIQLSALQDNCLQWIDTCKTTVREGLAKLLGFISTVKGLASIRDEVWEQLNQDSKMNTWDEVCLQVAKRKLQIWDEFFRPYFMDRAKALLQAHFDGAISLCKHQISRVLTDVGNWEDRATENERNLSNYIWHEGPTDLPANMAWVPVGSRSTSDASGLMMKAKAYTPAVQGLCKSFDSKVKVLLEDGNHYLRLPEEGTTDSGPFDRFADHDVLHNFLESACQECVKSLTEHLNQQLYASQKQLSGNAADPRSCKIIIDRMLLLGRFCTALCELSPHLKQCMSSPAEKQAADKQDRTIKKVRSSSKINENPKWTEMRSQLHAFGQVAYKMWTGHMAQSLVTQFNKFLSENSQQALIRACTKWDDIVIEEETEEGQKIKSTIRVPMQVSWYLQSLLYDLCEEINRIGGHSLQRVTLVSLVTQLSDGVIDAYETLLDAQSTIADIQTAKEPTPKVPLTQNRALQLVFDLRAFTNVMPRRDETPTNTEYHRRSQKLVDRLEALVDPFDLDVFMPYIQGHLARHTQRSHVLYGALMSLDRHSTYTPASKASSSTQQEQHNVLPLTGCSNRFPLLPLSVQTRRALPQPIIQSPKPLAKGSPLMSPSLGPSSPPPVLSPTQHEEQSSSFFGQMSTIWFSNVGSKTK